MIESFIRSVYIFAVLLITAALISCGGGGGATSAGTGTLNLSLTDAASGDYKAVYVTINEVWVKHTERDWEMLNGPDLELPQTLNLLDFVHGFRARLGYAELEAGHYTQMRLIVDDRTGAPQSPDTNILSHAHPYYNYVIDLDNNEIFLKVPSGGNTGIKLVGGFDIENAKSTDIVIDFDANKSVHAHPAGKTGEWRLRPAIKVVEIINSVSGRVVRMVDEAEEAVPNAWVSAQIFDTGATDFKDEVTSVAGVFSKEGAGEDAGIYFMLLPKNISGSPYNIVATKTDLVTPEVFVPECQALDSTESNEYINVNFTLTLANKIGEVTGSITGLPIPGQGDNYSVYLSIRKHVDCDGVGDPEIVEMELITFVNDQGNPIPIGPITLPGAGEYEIVAWADGAGTLPPFGITIDENGDDIQNTDLGEIDFGF